MTSQDMTVQLLDTGTMECDETWLLLQGGRTIADRHHRDMRRRWVGCPTHAVLIRHPDATLLWDTGVPRDWETRWSATGFEEYFPVREPVDGPGFLDSALAELELAPDDIDILVLSHLHLDHAANAQMFTGGHTRIFAHTDEIDGVAGLPESTGAYIIDDFDGINFEPISGDTEILDGVTLVESPGHSWGTMSLQVDLPEEGTKLFTSDAVYLEANWGPPAAGAAIVWDNVRWLESVQRLRQIAERTDAQIIFGHDEHQKDSLRFAPHGHYR